MVGSTGRAEHAVLARRSPGHGSALLGSLSVAPLANDALRGPTGRGPLETWALHSLTLQGKYEFSRSTLLG